MTTEQALHLDVYINYPGHCEEAFRFYEQHLGGKITMMMAHEQQPPHFPKEWKRPIMHATMELGGMIVRGADVPDAQPMRSTYLTLRTDTAEGADEIYALLTDGGEIFMPMQETFYANRFAMFRDKFGTSWMLMNQK